MSLRDLLAGRSSCAAPGSSSSSPNPLSALVDNFIGYSPKPELTACAVLRKAYGLSDAAPLSTVPGDANEFKLDQGSIRTMKGTDFVNGHHGDSCGENFQTSIRFVPKLRGIERLFHESQQIDSATGMDFMPKFDGPPEMDVPYSVGRSPFQPYNVAAHQSKEDLQGQVNKSMDYIDRSYDNEMKHPRIIPHPQMKQVPAAIYELQNKVMPHSFQQQHGGWASEFEQSQLAKGQMGGTDITDVVILAQCTLAQTSVRDDHSKFQGRGRLVMRNGEVLGGWLSFLRMALSHLGGLSRPRFWDERIKWQDQEIGRRVWIELKGLPQLPGWSVAVEATRSSYSDALHDAAMLAVITLRLHFPVEFRGTPFMVLPMVPGQRSKLDYPAIGGGAEDGTFMGINCDHVWTLQQERFASFHRERWETSELKEYFLEKRQSLAVAKKMPEELPPMLENDPRIAELSDMGNMEGNFIPRDCGWSVFVSDKAQKQVEPPHEEDKPSATASSPAVSVRARM